MKTVTSVSGGKTSAYLAANYPTDYNVFSLVRVDDKACKFRDEKIRLLVEDKIQKPFIGTVEDDMIIYTILDLEQFLGKDIFWVSGDTFDEVLKKKSGYLPNKLKRFCTTHLKIEPIFYWWAEHISSPIIMNFGYRANEVIRAKKMRKKVNDKGLLEMKATFGYHDNGKRKWELIAWQKPNFPLIDDFIFKDKIVNYWSDKKVRFAERNNCIGCFYKNPMLLNKMFQKFPEKMNWFKKQELEKQSRWRSDVSYSQIKNYKPTIEIQFDDFSDCDSGFCEFL